MGLRNVGRIQLGQRENFMYFLIYHPHSAAHVGQFRKESKEVYCFQFLHALKVTRGLKSFRLRQELTRKLYEKMVENS